MNFRVNDAVYYKYAQDVRGVVLAVFETCKGVSCVVVEVRKGKAKGGLRISYPSELLLDRHNNTYTCDSL